MNKCYISYLRNLREFKSGLRRITFHSSTKTGADDKNRIGGRSMLTDIINMNAWFCIQLIETNKWIILYTINRDLGINDLVYN